MTIAAAGCSAAAANGEAPGPNNPEGQFLPPIAKTTAQGVTISPASRAFIDVATVGDEAASALVRAPGRVAFRDGAVSRVGAPVNGRIAAVFVRAGQHVERGERLLALQSADAASLQAELERARVGERAATAELERQRTMKAHGVGIESDLIAAQAHLDEARAELARARSSAAILGRTENGSVEVRAPIAGDVLALHASLGAVVSSDGDPIVELGDANDLWMVTDVFERELPLLHAGDTARAEVTSSAEPLALRVISVGAAVDPETRRAPVYLAFEGDHAGVRAGMYARVTLQAGASAGIGVPSAAVLVKDGGKTVVYVAKNDTTFVARDVSVGHPVDGRVPVLAGLHAGERIAVRGALLLDASAEQLL